MDGHRHAAERDEAYRALGRYIAEFSRLIFHMRSQIAYTISGGSNPAYTQALIALGEGTADPIRRAFFAICTNDSDLDVEEMRIASKLEEAVGQEIKRRNDYAHGDWFIGWGPQDGPMDDPSLWRIKPSRKDGPLDNKSIRTEELDSAADKITALRQLVAEFGDICLGGLITAHIAPDTRVRDVFMIEGSRRSGSVIRQPNAPLPPIFYA